MHDQTDIGFSFGKNWQRFVEKYDTNDVKHAQESIEQFMPMENVSEKSVLDIGGGSGLFSYVMSERLNAHRVVTFDVDEFSVACCTRMKELAGNPENWNVYEGSILDQSFISTLGTFDVVYSWGVLHHTGRMWEAIEYAARMVKAGGYFYIALYNRVDTIFGSRFWLSIKRIYNRFPFIGKYVLETGYILAFLLSRICTGKNPFKEIRDYGVDRNMNWRRDVTDWVGGYPYEFASVDEVFHFMQKKFPDFHLANIKTVNHLGCNWFLFKSATIEERKGDVDNYATGNISSYESF